MSSDAPPVILLAGPTASGKTALAIGLARALGATIVNADSMQVYAAAPILTARPSPEEEHQAPHVLYGVAGPQEDWSVAIWAARAAVEIARLQAAGQRVIVTGGTGLYFRALTHGLSDMPAIADSVREELRAEPDLDALRTRLAVLDPEAASRLKPNDRARITRALEVVLATGRKLAHWQAEARPVPILPPGTWRGLVVAPDRTELHARINRRFDQMIDRGALDEVAGLMALNLPWRGVMKAIGVRPLSAHLAGDIGLAEAIEQARAETRQYAKRQETWFRNQMPDWTRIDPGDLSQALAAVGEVNSSKIQRGQIDDAPRSPI